MLLFSKFQCIATNELISRRLQVQKDNNKCKYETGYICGDILSDEAGQIAGSIGMLPSASIGVNGMPGLFEPIHGSAPDIAGQDKANPFATMLSVAMMMRTLGEDEIASEIENAVKKTLASGLRTSDITFIDEGKNTKLVGTKEITKAVIENL